MRGDGYISVKKKFFLAHTVSTLWVIFSIYVSIPWVRDLSVYVSLPLAIFIISGISYIPGYLNAFLVSSLLLDQQSEIFDENPDEDVTLMIAAYNEEEIIYNTLSYLKNQDYAGSIKILVIDNNSNDHTSKEVLRAKKDFNLNLRLIKESKSGKFNALNTGLKMVDTKYVITLDADTILLRSSIRYIVARLLNSPKEVKAVAGSMLVRNSREGVWAKIQEWDYFLGISSIKRLQGLYQGTLVAQGAYSIYDTEIVKSVDGWPDAIGEDIVLTWRILEKGYKVFYEPLAVAFTEVPITLKHFARQRSRWARGMFEGLKEVKPWEQPEIYMKYLTFVNMLIPIVDISYTFVWLPGLILAFFGHYYIVGPMTLLVLPLTLISYSLLYNYQKKFTFNHLNLRVRKNYMGFILYLLVYQIIMSPIAVYGYIEEILGKKRIWK